MADAFTLTNEEAAELQQPLQGSQPVANPFADLTAEDIADLSVQSNGDFDPVSQFAQHPDVAADRATVEKVAKARQILHDRGTFQKLGDLSPRKAIAGTIGGIAGGVKRIVSEYPEVLAGPLAPTVAAARLGLEAKQKGVKRTVQEQERKLIEQAAGTEAGTFGFVEGAKKIVHKAGETVMGWFGLGPGEANTNQQVADLWEDVGLLKAQEDISQGKGGLVGALSGETQKELEAAGLPVRPEAVGEYAAVDPFSFMLWGKALKPVMGALPRPGAGVVGAAGEKAAQVAGKAVELGGKAVEAGGKAVEAVAPAMRVAAPVVGGVTHGIPGAVAGVAAGKTIARNVAEMGAGIEKAGAGMAQTGVEAAAPGAVRGTLGQAVRDVAQATPAAALGVGEGVAFDVALAGMTSDNPQQMANASAFGTLFGLGRGAFTTARHVVSGNIVSPRAWGSVKEVPYSGVFPEFDRMQQASVGTLKPAEVLRLNSLREFARRMDAEVYFGTEAEMEKALTSRGIDSQIAKQAGFFTTEIAGPDGKPRRVVMVTEVGAAPHEARHAIENVIGESGMRQVDRLVQQEYAPHWEQLGQRYVQAVVDPLVKSGRVTVEQAQSMVQNWRQTMAEGISKWTSAETLDRMIRAQEEASGMPLDDAMKQQIAADWQDLQQRGGTWRDVITDPAEQQQLIQELGDRYLSRELAAENFDAAMKNMGTSLERKDLVGRLAWFLANTMRNFGTDPFAGRVSETQRAPLNVEVMQRTVQQGREAAPAPVVEPKGAAPKPTTAAGQTQRADAWAQAHPEVADPQRLAAVRTLNTAIESGQGVRLDYLAAKGAPGGDPSAMRPGRRAEIESARGALPADRQAMTKDFFPISVETTEASGPQYVGWSPNNFRANHARLMDWIARVEAAKPGSTSGLIPADFDIENDSRTFIQNQLSGGTGSGRDVVVPEVTQAAGYTQPERKGGLAGLPQDRADVVNYLFGNRLPGRGPKAQAGRTKMGVPLNIAGQQVAEATAPGEGRVTPLVEPRTFEGKQAEKMGVAGMPVQEVNPFRAKLEAVAREAKMPAPELLEVQQRLNVKEILDATVAPELERFGANTLTLQAGFQPHQLIGGQFNPRPVREDVEFIRAAAVRNIRTGKIETGMMHPLIRDRLAEAGDKAAFGDTYEDGFYTSEGRFVSREEATRIAAEAGQVREKYQPFVEAERAAGRQTQADSDYLALQAQPKAFFQDIKAQFNPKEPREFGKVLVERIQKIREETYKLEKGFAIWGKEHIAYRSLLAQYSDLQGQEKALTELHTAWKYWAESGEHADSWAGGVLADIMASAKPAPVEAPPMKPELKAGFDKAMAAFEKAGVTGEKQEELPFGGQAQPKTVREYSELAEDPVKWTGTMRAYDGGLTKAAYDLGSTVTTPEALAELKAAQLEWKQKFSEAAKAGKIDEAMGMATTAQFFREAGEAATGTGSAGQFLRRQGADYKPPLEGTQFQPKGPAREDLQELDRTKIQGGAVTAPHPTYDRAVRGGEGENRWVRRSADPANDAQPDNTGRSLLVQLSSDLINANVPKGGDAAYYDKLYSGTRTGYARLADFWEIPQWVGFASRFMKNADLYVVRDMESAKKFIANSKYDRVAFSALDVNKELIRELVAANPEQRFDIGGYVEKGSFDDLKNATWHGTMQDWAKSAGVPYEEGVDYRHFQGSDVIPRLTMSQGCKHKCAFCTVEKTLVETPKEVIEQQADEIGKLGAKLVYLNDKTFGQAGNYQDLAALNERIKASNPDFKGFIIQTTASQMLKFPVEWLKKSGIQFVELGIESYNDPILKAMHKPATTSLMDRSVARLREAGITLIPNIIIGLPGETAETYARTLDFLKRNKDIISHANVYNLALYKEAELGKKITTATPDDFNENVLEKSFHTNPEVHRVFAGDVYGIASRMLDEKPVTLQFQPGREAVAAMPIEDMKELWPKIGRPGSVRAKETPETGAKAEPGEQLPGQLAPRKRDKEPMAEPPGLTMEQFEAKWAQERETTRQKTSAPQGAKMPAKAPGGFKKIWVLPDGEIKQLGGTWHHQYLSENPDVAEKYGLAVPPFEGQDVAGVREDALKAGFARVNYEQNTGTMTVELRASDWKRPMKNAIVDLVEANASEIDNMKVILMNRDATKAVEEELVRMFRLKDDDKPGAIPFMGGAPPEAEGEVTGPSMVGRQWAEEMKRYATIRAKKLGGQLEPQAGEAFSAPEFKDEVEKVRKGKSFGQTFSPDGSVWAPEDRKVDLVSLASVNLKQSEVTPDTVLKSLRSFSELLDEPNVNVGLFTFEKDGKKMVSVDLNAVVPQDYRENTKRFAKDNDQVAIWDADKGEAVETGGKGNTKLTKLQEVLDVLDLVTAGEPVDVPEILKEYAGGKLAEQQALAGFEGAREYDPAAIANMTRSELREHFPEAVVPRRETRVTEGRVTRAEPLLTSDVTESPLYKQAKNEADAVELFANKMVKDLEPWKNTQAFKDGSKWYSEFTPRLKKAFGPWADRFAELLAASSPQTDPKQNFQYAHEALRSWQDGRFDKQIAKFNEGMEKITEGSWEKWLDKQIKTGKASAATAAVKNRSEATFLAEWIFQHDLKPRQLNGKLYGQHSDALLQVFARRWLQDNAGPKTRNFVENLLGISHSATIDLWADRTMRRLGYEGLVDRWRILPKNQSGVRDVDFAFAQKVFETAAKKLEMKADDLQGALWFAEKMNWALSGWGRLDLGDYRNEISKLPMLEQKYQLGKAAQERQKKRRQKTAEQQEFGLVEPRKP